MFGDIYATKYMGKTTDTLEGSNFGYHKTNHFKPKRMLQVEKAR